MAITYHTADMLCQTIIGYQKLLLSQLDQLSQRMSKIEKGLTSLETQHHKTHEIFSSLRQLLSSSNCSNLTGRMSIPLVATNQNQIWKPPPGAIFYPINRSC